jgi:hypothetical protein
MKNSSSQNSLNSQQPVDSIQQPIFKKLFRDLGVPSEHQNGLSRDLSSFLGSIINDETQIEQLSKAYILEFLKGIGLNSQNKQLNQNIGQASKGSSLFSKIIKGDDNKKAQINLIYQISKEGIFNSLYMLRKAKDNLSNTVKSLANIIKNDKELLKIYTANKADLDIANPYYQPQHIGEISSISAMIANDLSDDFKRNPDRFSHLGINQEQLDEIALLTSQQINEKIQKGIDDKKQSRLENIEKSIEEDLISLLHVGKKTKDEKKNALEEVLETGKILISQQDNQIKVTKINDIDAQNKKEIIKNNNDQFIKNIKEDNRQNNKMIDEESIHFDFGSTSQQKALALIASLASNFINRGRTEFKIEILDSFGKQNSTSKSPSQYLNADRLQPNPRFTTIE